MSVLPGLGWPQESPVILVADDGDPDRTRDLDGELIETEYVPAEILDREEVVATMEEIRDEISPEWSVKRGTWNLAIMIVKGMVKRR